MPSISKEIEYFLSNLAPTVIDVSITIEVGLVLPDKSPYQLLKTKFSDGIALNVISSP